MLQRQIKRAQFNPADRTILAMLVVDYIDHYNQLRPHRGINQRAPNDTTDVVPIRPGHRIERTTYEFPAPSADRCQGVDLSEAFGVGNGRVLAAGV